MGWLNSAWNCFKKFGPTVRFASKLVLSAVLPGSPVVVDLVCDGLAWAEKQSDKLDKGDKGPPLAEPQASPADQERLEQVFATLSGELAGLMAQVAALQNLPQAAEQILSVTLATDERCKQAAARLSDLAKRFDRLEEQNRQILQRQGYACGLIEEMLPLMKRLVGVADFVDELKKAGMAPSDPVFLQQMQLFRQGAQQLARGQVAAATADLSLLAEAQPASASAQAALACAQAVNHDLGAAQRSLTRAVGLRPHDPELVALQRQVTHATTTGKEDDTGRDPINNPARRQPKVGDVLDGWKLEQLLGHGGWGQVFQARRGDKVAALKVMHTELCADPSFVERFKHEIMTLARLGAHPNLVEIHNFGYAPDFACWYFLMQMIEGVSLEHYLARNKKSLSTAQARKLFLSVARGLAVAHQRGIVHRDIKPANILLSKPKGDPVLVDFGLAVSADGSSLTRTGQTAGYTAMFAAPEQLRNRPADARSDVYALAGAMYYCLTFDQPDVREPECFEPRHVPAELRELLSRALHHKPDHRPADAAAFVRALEATASSSKASSSKASSKSADPAPTPVPPAPAVPPRQADAIPVRPVYPGGMPHQPGGNVPISRNPTPIPVLEPAPLKEAIPVLPVVEPIPVLAPADPIPVLPGNAPSRQAPAEPFRHHVGFMAPDRKGYGETIMAVFHQIGYVFAARHGSCWTFQRGSERHDLRHADIRACRSTLTVRITSQRMSGSDYVRIDCDWEVLTFTSVVPAREINRLEDEVRRLQEALPRG
jgi:serine/threonine protein kinase